MKPASKKWKMLGKVLFITAALLAAVWWGLPFALPLPGKLTEPVAPSLTFLASDGTPLRQLLTGNGQRVAQPLVFNDIPKPLLQATLAAEDRRFFAHPGIDFSAIARALWDDMRAWRVVSGASTITQQLAKNSATELRSRTIIAKVIEALQARRIEMTWDKQRILTEYLNRISYGNLFTGCASAAQGYFHKPLRDLTPAECAFLAALPQSPTRLNPFKNFEAVKKCQQRILTRMHDLGWLDDEAVNLALNEKLTLQRFTGGFEAPHAVALLGNAGGSSVLRTSINANLQSRVESIITARLALLRERHVTQAAAVVIENRTGRVLALAGSRDFFSDDSGQINGAWMPHSAGSAVKPFTYLLALQKGFTPATVIQDLPIEFSTTTGIYRPENYDHRNYGPVTL
ncbi:MAG: transglycosylase domain-containing protein, partial [Verrucomicrobiaceae bacterium]